MKPKSIIFSIILAITFIILFFNKEETTFWLFGEIRTSKLIILGVFYLLGIITGGILFRRRSKKPKTYSISDEIEPEIETESTSSLSDEDRRFLGKD